MLEQDEIEEAISGVIRTERKIDMSSRIGPKIAIFWDAMCCRHAHTPLTYSFDLGGLTVMKSALEDDTVSFEAAKSISNVIFPPEYVQSVISLYDTRDGLLNHIECHIDAAIDCAVARWLRSGKADFA